MSYPVSYETRPHRPKTTLTPATTTRPKGEWEYKRVHVYLWCMATRNVSCARDARLPREDVPPPPKNGPKKKKDVMCSRTADPPLTSRDVFARALVASCHLRPLWKVVLGDPARLV